MTGMFTNLPQVLIDGLVLGFVYAVVALGYTMVYGILELINFAHGEIFMAGAVVSTLMIIKTQGYEWANSLPPILMLLVLLLISGIITGVFGVGVERLAYRPLRKQSTQKLAALVTALSVSLILQDSFRFFIELTSGGNYEITSKTLMSGSIPVRMSQYTGGLFHDFQLKINHIVIIITTLIIVAGLDFFVNRTKWGTAMRAVAQDRHTASLMAIDVSKVILITFLIGSFIGGATGVLYAQQYTNVNPYIGVLIGIKAFVAAVLGGIGNLRGAVLGGILIGMCETLGGSYLSQLTNGAFGSSYKDIFALLILIIVLLFKPNGLLGRAIREKV
ncbi:branched-chain amino acid ABC transporter permease [Pasteuria penetrans]|uniref:branched-chain amino acid ABC transporter permease n=1 Tax=Pasteuria penetrans TaxID=86005 RepID=UPI000FB46ADA|nr:branched-chain amino acid ABC transporter permease [Pasteuria penetrans]